MKFHLSDSLVQPYGSVLLGKLERSASFIAKFELRLKPSLPVAVRLSTSRTLLMPLMNLWALTDAPFQQLYERCLVLHRRTD